MTVCRRSETLARTYFQIVTSRCPGADLGVPSACIQESCDGVESLGIREGLPNQDASLRGEIGLPARQFLRETVSLLHEIGPCLRSRSLRSQERSILIGIDFAQAVHAEDDVEARDR